MRLVDADELLERVWRDRLDSRELIAETVINAPTIVEFDNDITKVVVRGVEYIKPERKKDVIQSFHDYQIEWLTSHCDLELEPVLESWIVRFLHDTANCYMMEVEHD